MPRTSPARADTTPADTIRAQTAPSTRYLVPRDAPRYRELVAALVTVAVFAHLLLAQLTLLLAAALYVIARISRWRPQWLAVPAVAGLLWTLAIGPSQAASGLAAGPRQVVGYITGIGGHPGHLLHPLGAFAGLPHWLPQQFPLALILAAAEVFGLCWLQRRLNGGREWRPGLIVAGRRWMMSGWIRSGGVVTRDGAILGVDMATGRPVTISWREAESGVLCAGPAAPSSPLSGPAGDGMMIALAAIRRRKPVVVVDLSGSPGLAGSLAAACREPGAPFSLLTRDGPGCYEPLRGGDPARVTKMISAMVDWSDVSDQRRRSAAAYLADAVAVQAAAPAGRRVPVLEDIIGLLTPAGLRERAAMIPAYHPRRDVLADRAAVSASLLAADPVMTTVMAEQLTSLRESLPGRWLRPASPDEPWISLGQTIRERGVTLFSLDRAAHGVAARMIAALVVADLAAVGAELEQMSVPGDAMVWINGPDTLGQQALEEMTARGLIARGATTGMAVVLSTVAEDVAQNLAAGVSVLAAHWPASPSLLATFSGQGPAGASGGAAGSAATGGGATAAPAGGAFALLARGTGGAQPRVLPHCRPVAARLPSDLAAAPAPVVTTGPGPAPDRSPASAEVAG
jgi:hypothetical protein